MRVIVHSNYATPTASATPGQQINLPDDEAARLIAGGYASKVDDLDQRRRRPETVDTPPSGSVAVILEWVGDDINRAVKALDVEAARSKPRKTLVDPLMQLLAADEEE